MNAPFRISTSTVEPKLRVLSLGAGVQSTTLALMAAHGELGPMPDFAVFADTGWEPAAVYEHVSFLTSRNVLPFPVHVVSASNIRDDIVRGHSDRAGRFAAVPWFLRHQNGKRGIGRRQCTNHYKLEPINRYLRARLGYQPRQRIPVDNVEVWVGISLDEIVRATPSRVRWQHKRFPLLERGMSRMDCLLWLARHGYDEPPKSACIGCPFRRNAGWRAMIDESPSEFADAVFVDGVIREGGSHRGMRGRQFMHDSLKPLAEVDLSTPEERGQGNLFLHECQGMCGL